MSKDSEIKLLCLDKFDKEGKLIDLDIYGDVGYGPRSYLELNYSFCQKFEKLTAENKGQPCVVDNPLAYTNNKAK